MKKTYIILLIIFILIISVLVIVMHYNKNKDSNLNITEISIKTSEFNIGVENKEIVINDPTEIKEIENIINSLNFVKETCDGLNEYVLIINNDVKYGIETYEEIYHITAGSKGEAKLTEEQTNTIKEIISKYF